MELLAGPTDELALAKVTQLVDSLDARQDRPRPRLPSGGRPAPRGSSERPNRPQAQ